MDKRRVGRTDVWVTELGFGGASVGNLYRAIDDETAAAAVDAAWAAGVRYFDTAPHYGLGLSERRLGAQLGQKPRDEYVISTKVGRLLAPNPSPTGSDLATGGFDVPDDLTRVLDYSRDGVLRSLDSSLNRLGLDRIDVVLVHDPDDYVDQAIDEAIPALVSLREQGVIGAVGSGMNFWQPLLRMVQESDVDVVMMAGRWTLADRSGEPLMAACEDRGLSVVAAAPFNSGLLARNWPPDDAQFNYEPATREMLARARELARRCQENGVELPHAAMQFPLRHRATAAVVSGIRTAEQAERNAAWAIEPIDDKTWGALE